MQPLQGQFSKLIQSNVQQSPAHKNNMTGPTFDQIRKRLRNTRLGQQTPQNNNYSDISAFENDIKDLGQDDLDELLDFVCEKGLHEHVKKLLENKSSNEEENWANPNVQQGKPPNLRKFPVLEAANRGFYEVLRVMKEDGTTDFTKSYKGKTILHYILRIKIDDESKDTASYEECLKVLLDKSSPIKKAMRKIVNNQDDNGQTAIHYATDLWSQDTVLRLLECGAHIGLKNRWQEIPISKIRPETMQDYLDSTSCLSSTKDVVHEEFSLTFHYDFLAPDKHLLPKKYPSSIKDEEQAERLVQDDGGSNKGDKLPLPETESLWYMGQNKQHRHLLKHPVITSFLWYKWKRIRKIFNRNLRTYTLFVFLLTWYVFENFGTNDSCSSVSSSIHGESWYYIFIVFFMLMTGFVIRDLVIDINDLGSYQNTNRSPTISCIFSYSIDLMFLGFMIFILIMGSFSLQEDNNSITINAVLKISLIILLTILAIREFFQMLVSIKRYVTSPENWIEVSMIILVSIMLSKICECDTNRHLAAIVIVLSWSDLVINVGKHPKLNRLNIYVTMFSKVLKDFTLFLLWYSMFIIAFGLGFYIMLHNISSTDSQSESNHTKSTGSVVRCSTGTVLEVPGPATSKQVLKCPDGTELEVKPEEEYEFFNKNWLSLVKTSTMFTGELEFGEIPIDLESHLAPLSYVFFLAFVLLVVVILMNLLTGLAVGEISEIRTKAEIYSYLSQVETISYIESMMLGDPFDFLRNVPKYLSRFDSCSCCSVLYKLSPIRDIFQHIGSGILLFYDYLQDNQVTVMPNKSRGGCAGHTIGSCLR